jgi:hypothetical protein
MSRSRPFHSSIARLEDYLRVLRDPVKYNTKSLRLDAADSKDEDDSKTLSRSSRRNGLEEISNSFIVRGRYPLHLELNRAGRRYLVQDGSSISKGVAVLSRVNDDINSVLHLENPRLCDRSAVEMSSSIGNY